MKPGTATSPTTVTLPQEAKEWGARRGVTLPATYSAYVASMTRADLDGAGEPGSTEGPVQGTTRPKRKGAEKGARRSR